ncbi:hypothetical protein ACJIZ3_014938 [Penstemon smallii]|uniref:Uncharacterized protein n=1 Tax=Penstemon smallii TaxID=265156 RepID=A0ABD3RL95_9LAMI
MKIPHIIIISQKKYLLLLDRLKDFDNAFLVVDSVNTLENFTVLTPTHLPHHLIIILLPFNTKHSSKTVKKINTKLKTKTVYLVVLLLDERKLRQGRDAAEVSSGDGGYKKVNLDPTLPDEILLLLVSLGLRINTWSNIAIGIARVATALGASTMPEILPSHGQHDNRRYTCSLEYPNLESSRNPLISIAPQNVTSPSPCEKCISPVLRFAPSTNTGRYTFEPLLRFLMSQFPPFSLPGIVLAASLAILSQSGVPSLIYIHQVIHFYHAIFRSLPGVLNAKPHITLVSEGQFLQVLFPFCSIYSAIPLKAQFQLFQVKRHNNNKVYQVEDPNCISRQQEDHPVHSDNEPETIYLKMSHEDYCVLTVDRSKVFTSSAELSSKTAPPVQSTISTLNNSPVLISATGDMFVDNLFDGPLPSLSLMSDDIGKLGIFDRCKYCTTKEAKLTYNRRIRVLDVFGSVLFCYAATTEINHLDPENLSRSHLRHGRYVGVPSIVERKLLLRWLLLYIYRHHHFSTM